MGGTQHPASPGVTPPGTPRDRDHSPGDTRPQRHRLPLCRRTWVLGTRDAPWGHHWCPCPPGQMGYGGPGCSPPLFTSCQLGQGGEALSALARVAISVISRGWGQGTAARTSTGAAPLCPSRTNAADRVMGAWPRHRGGTAGTCTAATRVSLITALRSTRTSAGEWHREPSATRCPVLWGTHGSVGHDVPPWEAAKIPGIRSSWAAGVQGDATGLTSRQPTLCHRGSAWCPLPTDGCREPGAVYPAAP